MKKAVVTVVGKDRVGIISSVSGLLCENNVNILDISQTILQGMFTMMMLVDVENSKTKFVDLADKLASEGNKLGVEIRMQLEDIFQAMHRI